MPLLGVKVAEMCRVRCKCRQLLLLSEREVAMMCKLQYSVHTHSMRDRTPSTQTDLRRQWGTARATVHALADEIRKQLKAGRTARAIYEEHALTMSYSVFTRHVRRLRLREPPQSIANKSIPSTRHGMLSATTPTTNADGPHRIRIGESPSLTTHRTDINLYKP